MPTGHLYNAKDGNLIVEVNYRLIVDRADHWWGELTLSDFKRIKDGDSYLILMEDGRKGRCFLKKKVNRAVQGLSPLYCYIFNGNGDLRE
ncbi:MAG: hypothetical protein PHU52_03480 [Dehalococcoidales bacterium]|jgi:hypothetical protein|nr:hypothetical protein [Dehalococcoidales bacterium]MDD5402305.1 hypothetical protein [Dehalococcoidales bacterium]